MATARRAGTTSSPGPQAEATQVGEPAVLLQRLSKRYGTLEAVRGIDLAVAQGETFGFLGPNGAGKSTTIGMLCTLVRPTSGSARVAGFDVVRERDAVRRSIGLVFQETTLDNYLTAEQNLRFHAELYGVPRSAVRARIEEVLELVGLEERRRTEVRGFSGGMKRRLEIARGLLHSPVVLFLDEPTLGLDPQTRRSIWEYIARLQAREGTTIFMTTHYMEEAELCDRIAIIDQGRLVALGSPEDLKSSVGEDRLELQTDDDASAIAALKARLGIEASLREGTVTFSAPNGGALIPRLFGELPVAIRSVGVSRPSLDDVFLSYTGRTIRESESAAGNDWMRHVAAHR